MTTKGVKNEDFQHWQVRDLVTGEILDGVQYADDETGFYIVRERTDRGVAMNRVITGAKIKLEDKRVLEEASKPKGERMLKWFQWDHLAGQNLQNMAYNFETLALIIVNGVESGPERTVALRKLLEAKDAAIRALVNPGG